MASQLSTLSPLLLYAVSATLPITLLLLPIFLFPRLLRTCRSTRGITSSLTRSLAVGLTLASTLALGLYGICGLVAIGDGSLSSAIAGGIFGALALISSKSTSLFRAKSKLLAISRKLINFGRF